MTTQTDALPDVGSTGLFADFQDHQFKVYMKTCLHHNDAQRLEAGCPVCQRRRVLELEAAIRAEVDHLRSMCVGLESAKRLEAIISANASRQGRREDEV
jgi:hypothetical protein